MGIELPHLPIDDVLPEVIATLRTTSALVLQAPTGAGKTTRVPPALWDANLSAGKRILLLEPRRLAARAAAARMVDERRGRESTRNKLHAASVEESAAETLGGLIGYQVRFERRATRATRILAVTDGVLLRMLQDDPLLDDVGIVVFDEFHERSLNVDLALALVRRVQTEVRPDLKLIVMSATLTAGPVAKYLGDCAVITSAGRTHPVEIRFLDHERSEPAPIAAARGAEQLLAQTAGDLLVFLPGLADIRRTGQELSPLAEREALDVLELYGDLPLEKQRAVLDRGTRRRIILATNVAETSVTVGGVTAVVDTGLANVLRFDPRSGMNRLAAERISQASADQRAGRAGREAPGICLRLWTRRDHAARAEQTPPEIARVELSAALLELLCWGETDVTAFPWFEAPPAAAVDAGLKLLERLGAVAGGAVTELGRQMARLPVAPRIARMLIAGRKLDHPEPVALAAALLSERDPFRAGRASGGKRASEHWSDSDLLDRLAELEQFAASGGRTVRHSPIDAGAARQVLRARDQLVRLLGEEAPPVEHSRATDPLAADEAVGRALLAGMPDRLARRREPQSRRAVMVGGKGVRLGEESAVTQAELFICVTLEEMPGSDALVRQASAVDRAWLNPKQLAVTIDLEFDPRRERVVAVRRTRLDDLVLDETPAAVPDDDRASALLAREAAARLTPESLLSDDDRQWLARVELLRRAMPELELPEFRADNLAALWPELCRDCQSFDDLRRAPLRSLWQAQLLHEQLRALEQHAPLKMAVPSGSQISLIYETGRPPVLAVRIQELFGQSQTPRVAAGRVAVLLHLLGPNYRPQQITDDLASFWANTYPQVRKDLRRRYPKHAWPDDPLAATAERRPSGKRRDS